MNIIIILTLSWSSASIKSFSPLAFLLNRENIKIDSTVRNIVAKFLQRHLFLKYSIFPPRGFHKEILVGWLI